MSNGAPTSARSWLMSMRWHDLLFMHWPVPAAVLRPLIPPALTLDAFDGRAWLGIVPFTMSGVRPRLLPPIPGAGAFPELNVRTYVTHDQRPGVWFFSLDAASKLAVRAARWAFHLPYFDADMQVSQGEEVRYRSTRTHRNAPPARLVMRYRPTGAVYHGAPGTIDHFLTHRLCLYCADKRGAVYRGDIDHAPWPLQPAQAQIEVNEMAGQIGLELPATEPLLHFAQRLDVLAWRIRRIEPPCASTRLNAGATVASDRIKQWCGRHPEQHAAGL